MGIRKDDLMLIAPHYVFPLEFNLLPKPPSPWEASASLIAPLPSWICASDLKTSPSTRVTSRHCVYIAIWNPAEQYSQRCTRYLRRESPRMVCLWVLAKLPGNQRVSISHSHGTDSILPETSWGSIVLRKGWQNRSECSVPPPPPQTMRQERPRCQKQLPQTLTYWMSLDLPLNESQIPWFKQHSQNLPLLAFPRTWEL